MYLINILYFSLKVKFIEFTLPSDGDGDDCEQADTLQVKKEKPFFIFKYIYLSNQKNKFFMQIADSDASQK